MGIQLVYKKMFENKWHFWLAGLQPIEGTLPHVTTLCLSIRTLGAKLITEMKIGQIVIRCP